MWILCTDVRDGQRLAFPQLTAAVSYDVDKYKAHMQEELDKAEKLKPLVEARAKAEIGMHTIQNSQQLKFSNEIERREIAEGMLEGVRSQIESQLSEAKQRIKLERNVEAVIWFNNQQWPVRSVRVVTSWDDVRDYTSGAPVISTKDLPSQVLDEEPKE